MASAQKITPCLWCDGNAEAAVGFYTSVFADASIDHVHRATVDERTAGRPGAQQRRLAGNLRQPANDLNSRCLNEPLQFGQRVFDEILFVLLDDSDEDGLLVLDLQVFAIHG